MTDISATLNEISGALSNISNQIVEMIADDRTLCEIWGWQQPVMSRFDLASRIQTTISKINNCTIENSVSTELMDQLLRHPRQISVFQSTCFPNFAGGNAYFVWSTLEALLQNIEGTIYQLSPSIPTWEEIDQKKLLPAPIKKRLDTISRGTSHVESQFGGLKDKFSQISEAHEAASNLPATLAGLESAREEIESSEKDARKIIADIQKYKKEIEEHKDKIEHYRQKSFEISGNIEEVHSAATRQGLGKAFQDRANSLKTSTYILMALLFMTLSLGGWISHQRIDFVEKLLEKPSPDLNVLWANIFLTAVSVAAPIWFAWLLTRQIGQRFRLAEDYGFKASVAKAYEGYRREANEIGDTALQSRLLEIALNRVDEAPLSHIEQNEAASPFHDFLASFARRGAKSENP